MNGNGLQALRWRLPGAVCCRNSTFAAALPVVHADDTWHGVTRDAMRLSDFDYELPAGRIAQEPLAERDASRLLLLERRARAWQDRAFRELPELLRGDELLVFNNTRVLPARLFAHRAGVRSDPVPHSEKAQREFLTSTIEVLLLRQISDGEWEALVRPGRKVRTGEVLMFGDGALRAEVAARGELGLRRLRFENPGHLHEIIERIGHMPLPPYIRRGDTPADRERYQTIFARRPGAVAAPTASLHFTPEILQRLRARGVETCEITLHVGLGTFQPVHAENLDEHVMHAEWCEIGETAAAQIRRAKSAGRPVLAVGTTVVRGLEDAAASEAGFCAGVREARIFIRPGHTFRVVDQMLTNFHLPRSTLLMLVSAFAGREFLLAAYAHAVAQGYRFYSYGDCMLIR